MIAAASRTSKTTTRGHYNLSNKRLEVPYLVWCNADLHRYSAPQTDHSKSWRRRARRRRRFPGTHFQSALLSHRTPL